MVAGVAMGLILEPSGEYVVLTDILGSEDALGDMDFKVAGDEHSISAFQLDIKVEGITLDIMKAALAAAKEGRMTVLRAMTGCDPPPRKSLSTYAPRIKKIGIPADKVGMVIGPGGKTIRSIEESTGAELDVDGDNCRVYVKAYSDTALNAAVKVIEGMTQEMEVGLVFKGAKVVGVVPFGAFVEIAPGRDGLVHVSEWEVGRVKDMTTVVKEGDLVDVQVIEIGDNGKVKLSRRVLMSGGGGNGSEEKEKENVAPAGGGRK
jgi:polyribonucleotide nucleotidyltransferase